MRADEKKPRLIKHKNHTEKCIQAAGPVAAAFQQARRHRRSHRKAGAGRKAPRQAHHNVAVRISGLSRAAHSRHIRNIQQQASAQHAGRNNLLRRHSRPYRRL